MKILQSVQKNLAIVGVCSNPTHASNRRIKLMFSLFVYSFAASAMYFCHDANTFPEYSSSMYITAAIALTTFIYAIIILNMPKLFDLISKCQEICEQSKSISFNVISICTAIDERNDVPFQNHKWNYARRRSMIERNCKLKCGVKLDVSLWQKSLRYTKLWMNNRL